MYSVCSVVTPSYKIGVDGGGTKTELILVDSAGTIVATHTAPGCNPSHLGAEQSRRLLTEALAGLRARGQCGKGEITATHLYMAGSTATWREIAYGLTDLGSLVVAADSVPVLELATGGEAGLVLHAGTGSFVAARSPDGAIHYSGGLGWRLNDAGSGYDIGRRAIAAALLDLQAANPSPLADALQAHTGIADYAANSRFFYSDPAANTVIAGFAPRVLELAGQNCEPARQAVADSVTDLARLADQVIHRLFPSPTLPPPCGISGRILNSAPAAAVLRSLAGKLVWPVKLSFIAQPPIEGVRRLLAKL